MTLSDPLMPTRRQLSLFFAGAALLSGARAASSPWQEGQLQTAQGRLSYARAGRGPLLVLLPGGPGGSSWALRHWAEPLTKELTVLLLDPIGRGRSARLADPAGYTLARDAEDLEALRQHLGLERLSVYGHSYGGLMAQAWAARHPQRVERLLLGNTLHGAASWQQQVDRCNAHLQSQHPQLWAELLALRAQGLGSAAPEYQALMGPALDPLYWHDLGQRERAVVPPSPQPELDRFNQAVYRALIGPDPEWRVEGHLAGVELLPALARVSAPTLVLTGRADRIAPPLVAQQLVAALPRARLQVFERSGHRPFIEQGAEWAATVSAFVSATA